MQVFCSWISVMNTAKAVVVRKCVGTFLSQSLYYSLSTALFYYFFSQSVASAIRTGRDWATIMLILTLPAKKGTMHKSRRHAHHLSTEMKITNVSRIWFSPLSFPLPHSHYKIIWFPFDCSSAVFILVFQRCDYNYFSALWIIGTWAFSEANQLQLSQVLSSASQRHSSSLTLTLQQVSFHHGSHGENMSREDMGMGEPNLPLSSNLMIVSFENSKIHSTFLSPFFSPSPCLLYKIHALMYTIRLSAWQCDMISVSITGGGMQQGPKLKTRCIPGGRSNNISYSRKPIDVQKGNDAPFFSFWRQKGSYWMMYYYCYYCPGWRGWRDA